MGWLHVAQLYLTCNPIWARLLPRQTEAGGIGPHSSSWMGPLHALVVTGLSKFIDWPETSFEEVGQIGNGTAYGN